MSWGQRGYSLIVVASVLVFGAGAINHWRARNYEVMSERIAAAGAKASRSVSLVSNEDDAYFMALLGDFSCIAITGVVGNGSDCTIDAALLRELRHYPEINRLRLPQANLNPGDFQCIYELQNLRWLNLAFSPLTDADLGGVEKLQDLDSLELQFTALTDASIPRLAKLPGLSSIDISGTDITPGGAERLRWEYRLAQGTQASTNVIYRPAPTPRFREAVIRLLPTKSYGFDNRNGPGSMRVLLRPEIWKGHEQDIPWIGELVDVETVSIQGMPLTPEMLEAVAKLPNLRQLNIVDTSTAGFDLSSFVGCRKLRTLRLAGMPLDEKFLASVAKIESLETLALFNCQLTPQSCLALGEIRRVNALRLREVDVDREAIAHLLVDLERSPRLRLLELTVVPIDNETIPRLARLKQLTSLSIASDDIDDGAVPELSTFTHLRQLDISGTQISLPSKDNPQDGATQLEAALLPAKVRVVHPQSKSAMIPLNLADLSTQVSPETAAPPVPPVSGGPASVEVQLRKPPR